MRILIANDDGIKSPGLAALEAAARHLTDDVWVVAPERKWSGSSHSVSLHKEFSATKLGEKKYMCSGTPVDGVVSAMTWLLKDEARPHLVLSGINDGQNVAEDVAYSGTLAIAREATFWGVPAIALSHAKGGEALTADAIKWLGGVIAKLWERRADWHLDGHWLSLNLPRHVPAPIRIAKIGRNKIARGMDASERADGTFALKIRDGRSRVEAGDDETALLAAGACSLVRLNWPDTRPPPESLIAGL